MTWKTVGHGWIAKSKHAEGNKPGYYGKIKVDTPIPAGTEIDLGCWVKQRDDGSSYFTVSAQIKEEIPQAAPPVQQAPPQDFNDDIPF